MFVWVFAVASALLLIIGCSTTSWATVQHFSKEYLDHITPTYNDQITYLHHHGGFDATMLHIIRSMDGGVVFREGLWNTCLGSRCSEMSFSHGGTEEKIAKVLLLLGIFFVLLSMLVHLIGTCSGRKCWVTMVVIQVFAMGCLIAGLCVFIVEVKSVSSEFGWSFILAWVAVAVYGMGFISFLAMLVHRL